MGAGCGLVTGAAFRIRTPFGFPIVTLSPANGKGPTRYAACSGWGRGCPQASFPYRRAQALAQRIGRPLTEFPGGHCGSVQPPRAFAEVLHQAVIPLT
jgi:hypothetical protein